MSANDPKRTWSQCCLSLTASCGAAYSKLGPSFSGSKAVPAGGGADFGKSSVGTRRKTSEQVYELGT